MSQQDLDTIVKIVNGGGPIQDVTNENISEIDRTGNQIMIS